MTTTSKSIITVKTTTLALICGALIFGVSTDISAQQQQPAQLQQPTVTKGTVAEVVRKGRATTLVILSEAGGDPINVPITPRIQFAVQAKGDLGFLAEKQVVSGKGTLTNNSLFVKDWTVHVGLSARKIKPFVKKSDKAVGQSQNSYDFAGTVSSRQQDKDYPDYETLITNIPQLKRGPIYIDKGATVTVSMTETDRVEEGAKVEYIANFAKGGRVQIVGLKVLLDKPLKSEELFKESEKKTSRRRSRS